MSNSSRWWIVILTVYAILATGMTSGALAAERLADKWYVDPKGFFQIIPPKGWTVQEYPQDPRGKVAFIAPDSRADLRILVNAVEFSTTDELVAWCRDLEKQIGIDTHIKTITFDGRPAVERSFEIRGQRLHYIDFLIGNVDHNLAFGAPPSVYEKYHRVAWQSMETYEPLRQEITEETVKQHTVAKMLRLAQLMLANNNRQLAADCIEEGLKIAPNDPALLELKTRLAEPAPTNTPPAEAKPSPSPQTSTNKPVQTDKSSTSTSDLTVWEIIGIIFAMFMFYLFFKRMFGWGKW